MEMLLRVCAALILFVAMSRLAHAYLDPVTGSLIIQGLIALVAAVVAGVRSVRARIVSALSSLLGRGPR